jgi:hypothetical protein
MGCLDGTGNLIGQGVLNQGRKVAEHGEGVRLLYDLLVRNRNHIGVGHIDAIDASDAPDRDQEFGADQALE